MFEYALSDGTQADYALCDRQGRPIAALEAKRASTDPVTAQDQGRQYAEQLEVPLVFLSNGEEVWFPDRETDAHALEFAENSVCLAVGVLEPMAVAENVAPVIFKSRDDLGKGSGTKASVVDPLNFPEDDAVPVTVTGLFAGSDVDAWRVFAAVAGWEGDLKVDDYGGDIEEPIDVLFSRFA